MVVQDISTSSEAALLSELTELQEKICLGLEQLKADTEQAENTSDILDSAKKYQSKVFADMENLRVYADKAETLIPDSLLPYPTYGKLLFSI